MTPDEYIEAAILTGGFNSKFFGELVPLPIYNKLMGDFILAADRLDKLKKSMFYGKPNAYAFFHTDQTMEGLQEKSQKLVDVIHAIIGIATEAGELCEALGKPSLDEVNIKEELGDVLWYVAVACKALNLTFEEVMVANIAKLKARFPERFTTERALNRDLENERKVLEQ